MHASTVQASAGSIIGFACAAGKTAADGVKGGKNGLFTTHLLKYIVKECEQIQDLLIHVSRGVYDDSRGEQMPHQSVALLDPYICLAKVGDRPANDWKLETSNVLQNILINSFIFRRLDDGRVDDEISGSPWKREDENENENNNENENTKENENTNENTNENENENQCECGGNHEEENENENNEQNENENENQCECGGNHGEDNENDQQHWQRKIFRIVDIPVHYESLQVDKKSSVLTRFGFIYPRVFFFQNKTRVSTTDSQRRISETWQCSCLFS